MELENYQPKTQQQLGEEKPNKEEYKYHIYGYKYILTESL